MGGLAAGQSTQRGPHSPAVQEVFDSPSNRSSQSPQSRPQHDFDGHIPERDILSMITNSNANNGGFSGMDFPEALTHLQNANGQSPLTPNQRNEVLQLMAGESASADQNGAGNALTSPQPPSMPDITQYKQQGEDRLAHIGNALKDQQQKVNEVSTILAPLSPSGSIPGVDPQAFGNGSDLDLDQWINTDLNDLNNGDYFTNQGSGGDFDFGTDTETGGLDFNPASNMNVDIANLDGAQDEEQGRVVEAMDSSEAPSPANTADDTGGGEEGGGPRKRSRRG